ncbi:MAG: ATP-grasp domain-containing protein [Methylobacter sp.]
MSILKILVFEYITGGGFNKHELPDSLANEGSLMLNALLDNLRSHVGIEITVMLDWRLHAIARDGVYAENLPGAVAAPVNMKSINTVIINAEHDISEEFARLILQSDAVWPVAPEFDGILQALCQSVESLGKILLTSPASAVAIAGNKFKTFELLSQHQIATVPTRMLEGDYSPGEWMVKPVDGVGCADSYVIGNRQDFEQISMRKGNDCMNAGAIAEYVIQPHLQGKKTSLSCLFKQGSGWLVCANLQRFEFINQQYHLTEIVVNHHADSGAYQQLVDQIAHAFPELWGYVGIDLIETAEQMLVLEINPRLTTSFVGIHAALGINPAEAVLQLVNGKPVLDPSKNLSITIKVKQETNAS